MVVIKYVCFCRPIGIEWESFGIRECLATFLWSGLESKQIMNLGPGKSRAYELCSCYRSW